MWEVLAMRVWPTSSPTYYEDIKQGKLPEVLIPEPNEQSVKFQGLMNKCLCVSPHERPTFKEILAVLESTGEFSTEKA